MKNKLLLVSAILVILAGAANAQIKNLYNFQFNESPYGSLTQSGSIFYGMTYSGGYNGRGYIFSINKNGTGFTDIWDFQDTGSYVGNSNGSNPYGTLILNGHKLYGMTYDGGAAYSGNVFSINTDGSGYKDLWDFDDTANYIGNSNGKYPYGSLLLVRNKLYGIASGGYGNEGIVFSIDTNGGAFKDLLDFSQTINSDNIGYGGLVLSGGKLFGTSWGRSCIACRDLNYGYGNVFSIDTDGTHYKDVYVFAGPNGANPDNSLTVSQDGKRLYGTTYDGGPSNTYRYGIVYGVDTNGTNFKTIHAFDNTDGAYSENSLTLSGSTLYGMTNGGGAYLPYNSYGYGTIFSVDTNGTSFNTIYNFNVSNGYEPTGGLNVIGDSLYGMTPDGGFENAGEIFACAIVSPASVLSIAHADGQLTVYPNPNNGQFTISIKNSQPGSTAQVEVYNVMGEKVYTQSNIENPTINVDLSNQANGVYMYRVLTNNNAIIGEGKLVIQK